jgi:hypothetical protein
VSVTFSVRPVKSVATLLKTGEMTANSGRVTVVASSVMEELTSPAAALALGIVLLDSAPESVTLAPVSSVMSPFAPPSVTVTWFAVPARLRSPLGRLDGQR